MTTRPKDRGPQPCSCCVRACAAIAFLLLPVASLAAADLSEVSAALRLYKSGKYSECAELTAPADPRSKQSETAFLLNMMCSLLCVSNTPPVDMAAGVVEGGMVVVSWVVTAGAGEGGGVEAGAVETGEPTILTAI